MMSEKTIQKTRHLDDIKRIYQDVHKCPICHSHNLLVDPVLGKMIAYCDNCGWSVFPVYLGVLRV